MQDDILNSLNEELEDVIEEGRDMLNNADLGEKLDEFKTEAELIIRKHPLQSVLIGAAAGFLLAKIFRSGS